MKFKNKFLNWITKHSKICALICLVSTGTLSSCMTKLHGEYGIRSWFQKNDPDIISLNKFEKEFGHEDSIVIAIYNSSGILNAQTSKKIKEITHRLKSFEHISRVKSLTNFPLIQATTDEIRSQSLLNPPFENLDFSKKTQQVKNEKELMGYLVSQDLKTSLIYAYTPSLQTDTKIIRDLTQKAQRIIKDYAGHGDKLYLSGSLPMTDAYREASFNDLTYLGPLALLVMFISFILIFKNPFLFIYPLSVILLSILGSLGFAGFLGFSFNNMTSALPVVLITIGMSDCIHILNWSRHDKTDQKLLNTLKSNFSASLLTSISTAIGFLSLSLSKIPPISQFGTLGAFGVLFAWLLTYLLAPICFQLFGNSLNRQITSQSFFYFVKRLHQFILYKYKLIITCFAGLSLIFLGLTCFNTVSSDLDDYFTQDFWAYKSIQFIKSHIGGVNGPEIVIRSKVADGIKSPSFLRQTDAFQERLDNMDHVTRTHSVSNIVKKMNQVLDSNKTESYKIPQSKNAIAERILLYSFSLPPGQSINHLYTVDNKALKINVLQNSTSSEAGIKLIQKIRTLADEMKINASIEGSFSLIKRLNQIIVTTILQSLGLSIFLVSILLVLCLKSPRLLLISLLPNLVPLIIAGGSLYLTSTPVDMGSMIVFSVCFGIAVDDTIHFFVRFMNYKKQGYEITENIYHILQKTGTSLIFTSFILMSGFLIFAFADFLPNKNFGLFSALVIVFALAADILLLPSILLYLERKKSVLW